jgi:hypothetical protein
MLAEACPTLKPISEIPADASIKYFAGFASFETFEGAFSFCETALKISQQASPAVAVGSYSPPNGRLPPCSC